MLKLLKNFISAVECTNNKTRVCKKKLDEKNVKITVEALAQGDRCSKKVMDGLKLLKKQTTSKIC